MQAKRRVESGQIFVMFSLFFFGVGAWGWSQVPQEAPGQQSDRAASATTDANAVKQPAQTQTEPVDGPPAAPDFSIFRVIGGLGIVLCLVVAAYFAARRYVPQYFGKSSEDKSLKLIETLSMGEKRSVAIVEIEEKRYLLGNTPGQITLLAELPGRFALSSDTASSPLTLSVPKNKPSLDSFRNIYNVEKGKTPSSGGRPIPPDIRAKMRQLRESLER